MKRTTESFSLARFLRNEFAAIGRRLDGILKALKQQSEPNHAKDEGERKDDPAGSVNAVVSFDDKTVRDAKVENDRQHATQNSIKNATWLAVVAAIGYATVAVFQYCAMLESNHINRESLESVQRAFISFQEIHGDRYQMAASSGGNAEFHFSAEILNNGNTPGEQVLGRLIGKIKEGDEPKGKEFFNTIVAQDFGSIGAKASTLIGDYVIPESSLGLENVKTTGDFATKARTIKENIFLYGWITYQDKFSQVPTHVTAFCQVLSNITVNAERPPSSPPQYHFIFRNCNTHNCTDKDCKDYKDFMETAKMAPPQ